MITKFYQRFPGFGLKVISWTFVKLENINIIGNLMSQITNNCIAKVYKGNILCCVLIKNCLVHKFYYV